MEFSKQESWNGLPFPSTWDLPDPRIEPASLVSQFFTSSAIWEAPVYPQREVLNVLLGLGHALTDLMLLPFFLFASLGDRLVLAVVPGTCCTVRLAMFPSSSSVLSLLGLCSWGSTEELG